LKRRQILLLGAAGAAAAWLVAGPGAIASPPEGTPSPVPIPEALRAKAREVEGAVMQRVYDAVKTPFKYGVILRPEGGSGSVDCPNVFRHGDRW
jgi:hypothetical protein